MLLGDHFASITFWTSAISTRPVQLRPGSHDPSWSSGRCVALRGRPHDREIGVVDVR